MELEEIKKKILAEIKRDTNGAVVESMLKLNGEEQFFSFGVSVNKIKESVKQYYGNHELALMLFATKIRELKLAAIYMEDPDDVTEQQIEEWSSSFASLEIAEHCCGMLFYKTDESLRFAVRAILSSEENFQRAGYLILCKRIKFAYDEEDMQWYIVAYNKTVDNFDDMQGNLTLKGVEQFFVALANKNKKYREKIVKLVRNNCLGEVGDEIFWQI